MKRIFLTVILTVSLLPLLAQNTFYEKYAKTEGITKVYISKSLLSLFKGNSSVDLGTDRVDISGVTSKLTGIYVLSTEKQSVAQAMQKDFEALLKKGSYELLMEVEDDEDNCVIYLSRDAQWIRDIYICAQDSSSFNVIQISGMLTDEDLNQIVAMTE